MTFEEFSGRIASERENPRVLAYDLRGLAALSPFDRKRVERMLLDWANQFDPRAVAVVADLESEEVISVLEHLSTHGPAWTRATALRGLARRRGSTSDHDDLAEAQKKWGPLERSLSAYDLKRSSHPGAIPLLLDALADGDAVVRVHAQEGLVEKLGLTELNEPRQAPLRFMQLRGMTTLPTLWPQASAELRGVFQAIRDGAEPKSLDLLYRPSNDATLADTFWEALIDRKNTLPMERAAELGEHDRAWLEAVLLTRLTTRDPRSPEALRLLGTASLKAHLEAARELVGNEDPPFRSAVEATLQKLAAPST